MLSDKCTLTDAELHDAIQKWVSKLCDTGGRAWTLSVPVNFDHDPDMLITELCKRHSAIRARVVRLEGVVRMLIGCVEDVGVNDEFEEELEAARKALEE